MNEKKVLNAFIASTAALAIMASCTNLNSNTGKTLDKKNYTEKLESMDVNTLESIKRSYQMFKVIDKQDHLGISTDDLQTIYNHVGYPFSYDFRNYLDVYEETDLGMSVGLVDRKNGIEIVPCGKFCSVGPFFTGDDGNDYAMAIPLENPEVTVLINMSNGLYVVTSEEERTFTITKNIEVPINNDTKTLKLTQYTHFHNNY